MRVFIPFLAALTGFLGLLLSEAAETPSTNALGNNPNPVSKEGDSVAQKFLESCSGCHSIGGGKMMGPDLITAASWSKNDLKPAIKRMEQRVGPLSDQDINEFADFIKDPQAALRLKAAELHLAQAATANLEPASPQIGQDLFVGAKPFANRGMACAYCHQVNGVGGVLGPDLTTIKMRMSETALQSAIQKASFKIMAPAYKTSPVTAQEALHLTKYLSSVNKTVPGLNQSAIWPFGIGLAGLSLAGLGILSHQYHFGRRKPLKRRRS